MSKLGVVECVLKTGLTEAIKRDREFTQTDPGVENGYHVTQWLKEIAEDFVKVSDKDIS